MNVIDFITSIFGDLISTLVILILGAVASRIPRSIQRRRLRKFFGNAVHNNDFKIVYGMVTRSQSDASAEKNRILQKTYHDGKTVKVKLGREVITREVVRASSYILQELARFRAQPVTIAPDSEVYEDLHNTFITIGGPVINEITYQALNAETNRFLKFSEPLGVSSKPWKIIVPHTTEELPYQLGAGKDYGIILKIRNGFSSKHFFFVCAGIATWGTSGAAWYLAHNWKALYKEFRSSEFGILVEVRQESDSSAIRVFPQKRISA